MCLNLEVRKGIDIADLELVFNSINGVDLDSKKDQCLNVYMRNSRTSITIKYNLDDEILSECVDDVNWRVGLRAYIYLDATVHNALEDIKEFIINLSKQTSFEFILSFEYESLYAFKERGELHLSGDVGW